ncbi:MAG: hypothetical protein AAGJ28_07375 [Pseudomonadota bacterium]
MSVRALIGPAFAALAAIAVAALFFDQARLPEIFPWSTVILPAVVTGVLALGIGMVLPDGLYNTRAEQMRLDLYTATGLTGTASARIIGRIAEAHALAARLRAATTDMREDTADLTHAAAEDLEELGDRLKAEPGRADQATTLITRAKLVVEAVESFIAFKADTGAKTEDVDAARARILESLTQMSEAADAVQTRLAQQKLTDVEVATDVAEGLFRRPQR